VFRTGIREESNRDVRRVAEILDVVEVSAFLGATKHGLYLVEESTPAKTEKRLQGEEEPVM
jgi:hypothetical protein